MTLRGIIPTASVSNREEKHICEKPQSHITTFEQNHICGIQPCNKKKHSF